MELFFQISESFFELITIFHKRGEAFVLNNTRSSSYFIIIDNFNQW